MQRSRRPPLPPRGDLRQPLDRAALGPRGREMAQPAVAFGDQEAAIGQKADRPGFRQPRRHGFDPQRRGRGAQHRGRGQRGDDAARETGQHLPAAGGENGVPKAHFPQMGPLARQSSPKLPQRQPRNIFSFETTRSRLRQG